MEVIVGDDKLGASNAFFVAHLVGYASFYFGFGSGIAEQNTLQNDWIGGYYGN